MTVDPRQAQGTLARSAPINKTRPIDSSMAASINLDTLPGDMAGQVGDQVQHQVGDFLWRRIPAIGDRCRTLLAQ